MQKFSRIFLRWLLIAPFLLVSCVQLHDDILPEMVLTAGLAAPGYSIGGSVSDLFGSETTLTGHIKPAELSFRSQRSEELPVLQGVNDYTFKKSIYANESYQVSVSDHPRSPTQLCTVVNASGKITSSSKHDLTLSCDGAYRIITNLTGLFGTGLVLSSSSGDLIEVSADGEIEFPTPFRLSFPYEATVNSNPTNPWQTCTFSGNVSVITGSTSLQNDLYVENLVCVTNEYAVTANISGLVNEGLLLALNGTDVEVPAGSIAYELGNLASGLDYSVTLSQSAVGQDCNVFGGSGSVTNSNPSIEVACTQTGYMVGGALSNYDGSGLAVSLSGSFSETKSVAAGRTGYYFNTALAHNDTYSVSVSTQPTSPWQTCSVTQNASGTILESSGSVTDVDISCTTNQYNLSAGTISGLSYNGLVLDVNGTTVSVAAGSTMADLGDWDSGTDYVVTVDTQPSYQTCTVTNSAGTVGGSDISDITVNCVNNPFPVGGTISGLAGSDTVTITDSISGTSVNLSNGSSTYFNLDYGNSYSITAVPATNAAGYSGCVVSNGTGSVSGPISNVNISCTRNSFNLTLTLTEDGSLTAGTNVLIVGGSITANFPPDASPQSVSLLYGSNYTVTLTQPTYSTCTVSSGSLTGSMPVGGASVDLNCTLTKVDLNINVNNLTGDIAITNSGTASIADPGTISADGTYNLGPVDIGDTYQLSISMQPDDQVCAFREVQYATLAVDTDLNINCVTGYASGQSINAVPPSRLDYRLYQGKVSSVAGSNTANDAVVSGGTLYYENGGALYKLSTAGGVATDTGLFAALTLGNVRHPVTDGTNLYFSNGDYDEVVKVPLDGSSPTAYPIASGGYPSGLALDQEKQLLYVASRGGTAIKRLDLSTGIVQDLADATTADCEGLVLLGGSLYATCMNHTIAKITDPDTSPGYSVLAGTAGSSGFIDGPLLKAKFQTPHGLTTDGTDLYVTDLGNRLIRKVDLLRGIVSTIAGNGTTATTSGIGIAAELNQPAGIVTDGRNFYVSETGAGGAIRKIADNGLVGYWPLNGATYDYASDVATPENGTLGDGADTTTFPLATTGRYGEAEGAFQLDGSNDYILAANTNLPAGSSPRTLCVWVKPSVVPSSLGLIASYGQANTGTAFGLSVNDGVIGVLGFGNSVSSSHILSDSEWSHLCGTYDANRIVSLYLNGKKTASSVKNWNTGNTAGLNIGRQINGNYNFPGAIADVRIYSRALNESEINELAQNADPALVGQSYNTGATGLLSHYGFDAESSMVDGLDNDGDGVIDAPVLNDSGPLGYALNNPVSPATASGKEGDTYGAYDYNGVDQYLLSTSTDATGLPLGQHPRTLCAWIKPASYPGSGTTNILVYGTDAVDQSNGISLDTAGKLLFFAPGGSTASGDSAPLHAWTHVCASYDNNQLTTLFINGKITNSSIQSSWDTGSTNPLRLGNYLDGSQFFSGAIDDVRIYNNALSADQVRQLAIQVPTGLVASYDFTDNGGTDDPLEDVSGWGGTLTNGGATISADRFGRADAAYSFDGTSSYLKTTIASALPQGNSPRTMCAWINPAVYPTIGNQFYIVQHGPATSLTGHTLSVKNSSGTRSIISNFLNNDPTLSPYVQYDAGSWQHVCGVHSDTENKLYLNGSPVDSLGVNTLVINSSILTLGSKQSTAEHFFNGQIDDVVIYNRALTQSEIQALVQQPNKKIFLTVSGYWPVTHFNSASGADVLCSADGANPGTGTYRAFIVDGITRMACSTADCGGGIQEHIDWVFTPNTTYTTLTNSQISTTDFAGIFPPILTGAPTLNSKYWTGFNSDWTTSANTCSGWNSTATNGVCGNGLIATSSDLLTNWGAVSCSASAQQLLCVEQ